MEATLQRSLCPLLLDSLRLRAWRELLRVAVASSGPQGIVSGFVERVDGLRLALQNLSALSAMRRSPRTHWRIAVASRGALGMVNVSGGSL